MGLERLKQLRKAKGWSLDRLARESGSSKGYLWELENKPRKPSAVKLNEIGLALGVNADYLMGCTDRVDSDKVLFWCFYSLSDKDRRAVMAVMDVWIGSSEDDGGIWKATKRD